MTSFAAIGTHRFLSNERSFLSDRPVTSPQTLASAARERGKTAGRPNPSLTEVKYADVRTSDSGGEVLTWPCHEPFLVSTSTTT